MLAAAVALHCAIDESAAGGLAANARAGAEMCKATTTLSARTRSAASALSASTRAAAAVSARTRGAAAVRDSLGQVLAAIVDELAQNGFENVAAGAETERIIVTYENRLYRYEAAAMREILRLVTQRIGTDRAIVLVPQRRQTPLLAVTFGCDESDCADPSAAKMDTVLRRADSAEKDPGATSPSADPGAISGRTDRSAASRRVDSESSRSAVAPTCVTTAVSRYWTLLQHARRANSSLFRADLALGPELVVQLGNYNDPVESQINLVPQLSVSLWKGMTASAQLIIPLQNELGEEGDNVRPGLVVASQLARLPHDVYVVGSVGYFNENRYGVDVQARRYFADGRWATSVNVGYTGRARFLDGTWHYTRMDDLTWQAALEHYVPRYTLLLRAAGGRFVYGDGGVRIDVLREFGEVQLGIFGLRTDQGSNAGISIAVPLPFRKYTRPALLRIRPERTFQWEYRFKGFPRLGATFNTGTTLRDLWYGITPAFIKRTNFVTDNVPMEK